MRQHIWIPTSHCSQEAWPIDTDDEVAAAREALRDAGLESAPVYHGDPECPDSYRDSVQVLFAAPDAEAEGDDEDESIDIGDYVEGGEPGTDDYDVGRVTSIEEGAIPTAWVAWSSGATTPAELDDLRQVDRDVYIRHLNG